jgi:sn1-specific diacylglycerol lipase
MIVRIGLFRLICLRKPKLLRYENKRPSVDVKGRRLSRLNSFLKNEHKRQRKWQWILQSLFCSYGAQNQKTSVFNAVSATLADGFHKFRGYVPTDILAGFALMKLKQITEKYKGDLDPDSVSRRKVNFSEKGLNNHLLRMIRYLKFCIGSYGWLFHIYSKGMYGLLQLIFLCGYRKKPSALNDDTEEFNNSNMIIGDNLCKWSTSVILRWTGIYHADLIYANFKNTVYCPVCYIAVDHREKSVVVIVRGTLSFADALTDLSAQPAYLMSDENGVKFYVHQGMLDSAQALHMKLEGDGLLQKIFNKYPSFKLVLAGHSLGAGVASILALILKPVYPKLHCYAYAPPGGLMNKAAAQYTKSFITAVFFENDIVPRLSIQNFEQLGNDMLKEIETCKVPKFRIFLNSFLEWTGCYKPHYHDFHHEKNDFETKQLEKVDGANSEEVN